LLQINQDSAHDPIVLARLMMALVIFVMKFAGYPMDRSDYDEVEAFLACDRWGF